MVPAMSGRSGPFLRGRPDTPADVEERRRRTAATETVRREVEEVFPEITPENARDVVAYQERRLRELTEDGGAVVT